LQTLARRLCQHTDVHFQSNRQAFMLLAGSPLLLRLLDAPWSHPAKSKAANSSHSSQSEDSDVPSPAGPAASPTPPKALLPHAPAPVWALRNEILNILRELCFTTPFFSESLAANATCVARFLELTSHKVRHGSCFCLLDADRNVEGLSTFCSLTRYVRPPTWERGRRERESSVL